MPTPESIKLIPTKDLPRIAEFFAGYRPIIPADQPWVEDQLSLVESEMLTRPLEEPPTELFL